MTPGGLTDASCAFDLCRDLDLKFRTLDAFPAFISKLTTITKTTGWDVLVSLKHLTFYIVIYLCLSLPVSSCGMKRMLKGNLEMLALELSNYVQTDSSLGL